jgi:hypothetical protein
LLSATKVVMLFESSVIDCKALNFLIRETLDVRDNISNRMKQRVKLVTSGYCSEFSSTSSAFP